MGLLGSKEHIEGQLRIIKKRDMIQAEAMKVAYEMYFKSYCKEVMDQKGRCWICGVLLNEYNISMWYSDSQPPTCIKCNEEKD